MGQTGKNRVNRFRNCFRFLLWADWRSEKLGGVVGSRPNCSIIFWSLSAIHPPGIACTSPPHPRLTEVRSPIPMRSLWQRQTHPGNIQRGPFSGTGSGHIQRQSIQSGFSTQGHARTPMRPQSNPCFWQMPASGSVGVFKFQWNAGIGPDRNCSA